MDVAEPQRPSFAMGYAHNIQESASPHLQKDLFAAWAPAVGRQGQRVENLLGQHPFDFNSATSPVWDDSLALGQGGPLLTWDRTAGSFLNAGDIPECRFLSAETWTVLFVYRIGNTSVDNCTFLAKWAGSSAFKQFFWHVGFGAAPQEINVFTAGSLRITTSSFVQLDTWYCSAVTNDGTGAAGGLRSVNFAVPSGALLDSTTGQHASDASNLTESVRLGGKDVSGNDIFDGRISAVYCYRRVLSDRELAGIARDFIAPLRLRARRPRVAVAGAPPAGGRIMSSLVGAGGLAGAGGIAGPGGGLAG